MCEINRQNGQRTGGAPYDNYGADDFGAAGGEERFHGASSGRGTYNNSGLGQVNTSRASSAAGKFFSKAALICAAVIFAACAAVFIAGVATVPRDTVMNNIYIDGIDLSGMTYDEALEKITNEYEMSVPDITLKCGGKTFSIDGGDIGAAAAAEDTARRAFDYGKDSNPAVNGAKNALRFFTRHDIKPAVNADRDLLIGKINEFGSQLYGTIAQHSVEINEAASTADITPGHTGYDPGSPESYAEALNIVLDALGKNRYENISVPLSPSAPAELTIEQLDADVYRGKQDAKYVINGNEVTVEPEVDARYLNLEEASAYLLNVAEGGEVVRVPYYTTKADITADALNAKLFADTLGSYSTYFGSSTANRASNVRRAAELINGSVLAPGDTFSFNGTVGKRTVGNGFRTATEYVNGESVQGIGGGTCQVSTTLYSAALYSDLEIVHRECHMMSVGYVPLGQDATVADDGVDFQFKNTTEYPIKISAYTDGGTLYVSIIGTAWEPERKVELDHKVSYSGENTVVRSTRYVYSNGELISTDPLSSSLYHPHRSSSN